MTRHAHAVAVLFQVAAWLLGLPSAAVFVSFGFAAARLHLWPSTGVQGNVTGNDLITMLVSGARIFGRLFEMFSGAAKWAFTAIAVAALAIVSAAVILFMTARGIEAGRGWARAAGIVCALLPLLISVLGLLAGPRPLTVTLCFATVCVSIYVIWALMARFA